MITLYGSPKSSAGRCFWCLEEIATPYTVKAIDFGAKEHKSEWFMKINPNGKVPALTDDAVTLFESMAINFYLADKYKPELLGNSVENRAYVHQWSFWSIAELQVPLIQIFIQKVFVPAERRSQTVIDENEKLLPGLLSVLNTSLQNKKYLAGNDFTLADLNTASVASLTQAIGYDISNYPNIKSWLGHITERPAFIKYMGMRH
jgi:glutathione S-transferase